LHRGRPAAEGELVQDFALDVSYAGKRPIIPGKRKPEPGALE